MTNERSHNTTPPLHIPVLFQQTINALALAPGQIVVDCTVGLGGHAGAIIERLATLTRSHPHAPGQPISSTVTITSRFIGIDLDPANLALARPHLEREGRYHGVQVDLFHANFAALPEVLLKANVVPGQVNALLADIGIASTQIDDPSRGFSYRKPGPLDMRMDPTRGRPASKIISTISEADLAEALLVLGDEADAPQIARLIVERRAVAPITTTDDLMAIVCEARDFTIERAAHAKLHPAARTFQALRILVNRELANLDRLLTVLPDTLSLGGIAAIITFHSGEDRRVKHAFRDCLRAGIYSEETRDPIVAHLAEREANPRARSAKLRWARRA